MAASEITLGKLRKASNDGVTYKDFPYGYRLASRVYDLRQLGHDIKTFDAYDYSFGYERKIARYVLIKENKGVKQ